MVTSKLFTRYQWFLRILSFGIMMQTLFFKFTAAPESIYIFTQVGMEPWGRIGTGTIELFASFALLTSSWAWLGALLSTVVMFGALFSHFTLLGFEVQGDGGLLFGLAVVNFASSVQTLFFQRTRIPLAGQLLRKLSADETWKKIKIKNIRLGFLFIGACLAIALIGIFEQAYTIKKLLEISHVNSNPVRDLAQIAYFMTILGVLLAFILAILLLRVVAQPIAIFTDACRQILHGSKTARVEIHSGAEWGLMAESFNNMLHEIQKKDSNMKSLLSGISNAVFFFEEGGRISEEKSMATQEIFPRLIECHSIADFFAIYASLRVDDVQNLLKLLWSGQHPFETLTELLPVRIVIPEPRVTGFHRYVRLEYRAEIGVQQELIRVIVVGTDTTSEEIAAMEQKRQTERVARMSSIGSNIPSYIAGEKDITQLFHQVEKSFFNFESASKDAVKRDLHSLKGALSFFHFSELALAIHKMESDIEKKDAVQDCLPTLQSAFQQFKTESKDIHDIFHISDEKKWTKVSTEKLDALKRASAKDHGALSSLIAELDEQHPSTLLSKYGRYLQELSERDGSKIIKFKIDPTSDEVSPSAISDLDTCFGHILRNSFDHGLETPDERARLGKSPYGNIEVAVRKPSIDQLEIRIRDDGQGIQTERLVQKALASGVWSSSKAAQASEQERIDLIFIPGLSAQDGISERSGRGVGMDAVKAEIERLGGQIHVKTRAQLSTEFTILIPRRLAS